MSACSYRVCRAILVTSLALFALIGCYDAASAQVALPQVTVTGTKVKPKPRTVAHRATAPATVAPITPAGQLATKSNSFDQRRNNLYTTVGTTSDTISHGDIVAMPQGTNATVEKVLLQAPGVSQDSAASGSLHVRNDHANVQYRINGVMLPDGVTGFSSVFDTGLIGSMSLVTGALPAEFGLRTVGLVDMTTRADAFNNSGSISMYGGSRGTIEPSFEYGGTFGNECPATTATNVTKAASSSNWCFPGVQYFFSGRYLQTTEGIENPTADAQRHPRFFSAGKRLRLHVGFRRPVDAAEPYHGHLVQYLSDTQCARRGPLSGISGGHVQFNHAQREPDRIHPI